MSVLITGCTGIIGSQLLKRFVNKGREVIALTRREIQETHQIIEKKTGLSNEELRKVSYVQISDISNVDEVEISGVDEVWHCAAKLSFVEEDRNECLQSNVQGTLALMNKLRDTGVKFFYVSTAYVNGGSIKDVYEKDLLAGCQRNGYEHSKFVAESCVRSLCGNWCIVPTILRPSIVVGDSSSGEISGLNGFYNLVCFFKSLNGFFDRTKEFLFPVNHNSTLNLVSIDNVLKMMSLIGDEPIMRGKTYHIVNSTPPKLINVLHNGFEFEKIENVKLVHTEDVATFEQIMEYNLRNFGNIRRFLKLFYHYAPYLLGEPAFKQGQWVDSLSLNNEIQVPKLIDYANKHLIRKK